MIILNFLKTLDKPGNVVLLYFQKEAGSSFFVDSACDIPVLPLAYSIVSFSVDWPAWDFPAHSC